MTTGEGAGQLKGYEMKTKTVKGEINTAYEKPVVPALSYSGEARQFENADEIRQAGAWPNDVAIVKMVNAKEVAKKRAELIKTTLTTAGYEAPTLEDDSVAIKETAKILLARKQASTQEEAEAKARIILGITEDETEDEPEEV